MIRTVSLVLAAAFLLAACGHAPRHAPQGVHELLELAEDGTKTDAFPQYWKRNTLVVDLRGAASAGKLILKPREGRQWPMRMMFRATPGTLGLIEVRADQRLLIPVAREGSAPVNIELPPGLYTANTEQMTVQWGNSGS